MWQPGICRGVLLVTLAPGALFAAGLERGLGVVETAETPAARAPAAPRAHCPAPRTLRLRRFEDRSAQVLCRGRVLVRISVPD